MVKPEHWFRIAKMPFLVYKASQDANKREFRCMISLISLYSKQSITSV